MFSKLITLVPFVALALTAVASPLESRAVAVVESKVVFTHPPAATLHVPTVHSSAKGAAIAPATGSKALTSANTGFQNLAAAAGPTVAFFTGTNCSGTAISFTLPQVSLTCYSTGIIANAAAVISPTGAALPWGVYTGTNCAGVQLPAVNTCYNISPAANSWFHT